MRGYGLRAIDKDLGSVEDFYFDDRLWKVRYLVAHMGNWLPGRKVIIGQEALEEPNWEDRIFPVTLTSTEVESSPGDRIRFALLAGERTRITVVFSMEKILGRCDFSSNLQSTRQVLPRGWGLSRALPDNWRIRRPKYGQIPIYDLQMKCRAMLFRPKMEISGM